VENLAEKDPLATVGNPLPNTQKKLEMIANPDMDGYTKTLNHWKILQKRQKYNHH